MADADDYVLTPVGHDPFADAVRAQAARNAQQQLWGSGVGSLPDPNAISRPAMASAYTPTLAEKAGNAVTDAARWAGASPDYASSLGGGAQTLAGFTPMSAAYDAGRAGAAGDYGQAALNALGALPDGGAGIAGLASHAIFAGPMARTADKVALGAAQKMAAEGADRAAIWNSTGWFQGADKQWRFEIPDDKAATTLTPHMKGSVPLSEAVPHPELYAAYPQLSDVPTSVLPIVEKGKINPYAKGAMYGQTDNGPVIGVGGLGIAGGEGAKNAIHEMQHSVQDLEGFQGGASPDAMRDWLKSNIDSKRADQESFASAHQAASLFQKGDSDTDVLSKLTDKVRAQYAAFGLDDSRVNDTAKSMFDAWVSAGRPNEAKATRLLNASTKGVSSAMKMTPMDAYQRVGGEVEARNVQTRMNMTPEERAAQPPWQTQDVPDEQQIVRFRNSGPQMSVDAGDGAHTLTPVEHDPFGGSEPSPPIIAYHGSPHSFDKFDLSKIGTGEGAQAYGHGLYFAQNEDVAKGYKQTLSRRNIEATLDGQPIQNWPQTVDALNQDNWRLGKLVDDYGRIGGPPEDFLRQQKDWYRGDKPMESALSQFEQRVKATHTPGSMYQVAINANPDHFLDWDKPLSEQGEVGAKVGRLLHGDMWDKAMAGRPEAKPGVSGLSGMSSDEMRALNRRLADWYSAKSVYDSLDTGRSVNATMTDLAHPTKYGSHAGVTEAMQKAGIPGIKYLDAGSRASGDGSRNYVVFNDKTIDILKKYGIAGLMGTAGLSAGAHVALTPVDGNPFETSDQNAGTIH